MAQSKKIKWKNAADSLVFAQNQQRWLHPCAGLHLSSDAELFYLGPSFQAGIDINITRRLVLSSYIQYFKASADNRESIGYTEKGRLSAFTSAILLQINAGKEWYKGFL